MPFLLGIYREEASSITAPTLSPSMLEAWTSLPADVRAALVKMETNAAKNSSESSGTSTTSSTDEDKTESEFIEEDIESGTMIVLKPLERAPKNVFSFSKTNSELIVIISYTVTFVSIYNKLDLRHWQYTGALYPLCNRN